MSNTKKGLRQKANLNAIKERLITGSGIHRAPQGDGLRPHMAIIDMLENKSNKTTDDDTLLKHYQTYVVYAMNYALKDMNFTKEETRQALTYLKGLEKKWGIKKKIVPEFRAEHKQVARKPEPKAPKRMILPSVDEVYPLYPKLPSTPEERYLASRDTMEVRKQILGAMKGLKSKKPAERNAAVRELTAIVHKQGRNQVKFLVAYLEGSEKKQFFKLLNAATKSPDTKRLMIESERSALALIKKDSLFRLATALQQNRGKIGKNPTLALGLVRKGPKGKKLVFTELSKPQLVAIQRALRLPDLKELGAVLRLPDSDKAYLAKLSLEKPKAKPKPEPVLVAAATPKAAINPPKPKATPKKQVELEDIFFAALKAKVGDLAYKKSSTGENPQEYEGFVAGLRTIVEWSDAFGDGGGVEFTEAEKKIGASFIKDVKSAIDDPSVELKLPTGANQRKVIYTIAEAMHTEGVRQFTEMSPTDPKAFLSFMRSKEDFLYYFTKGIQDLDLAGTKIEKALVEQVKLDIHYDPDADRRRYSKLAKAGKRKRKRRG